MNLLFGWKRFVLYVVGLFFLALGVSLSIRANLGVSPVSSLPYAMSLTTGITIGVTTIVAHVLYIMIQVLLTKKFEWKGALIQLMIAFLFGFFINTSLALVNWVLPPAETILLQALYLIVSLFLVAGGLFGYSNANFTLMPYDELTKVISSVFKMPFGKAKIIGDVINVIVAGAICLIFLRSFGSIGVGTIAASVSIGRILDIFITYFQKPLENSLDGNQQPEDRPAV